MLAFIIRRLLLFPVVLWGVTVLVFATFMFLTPQSVSLPTFRAQRNCMAARCSCAPIEKYGLDDPIRCSTDAGSTRFLHGNLGWSQSAAMPVGEALVRLFPATAELALLAIIPVVGGGISPGKSPRFTITGRLDHLLRFFSMISRAFPSFVFGLIVLDAALRQFRSLSARPPQSVGQRRGSLGRLPPVHGHEHR